MHKHLAITFLLFGVALVIYLIPIYRNTVAFFTDEMYWISTANTVHLLQNRDTKNPLWRENYGFTNFNGAKYVYGVGLLLFGHRDVRITGTAPQTYYRWISFEPMPFPIDHAAFSLVIHARIISAVITALAISLLYPLGILIGLPALSAALATILFGMHPIVTHVATHAFSDGILLLWQMILLLSLFWHRRSWGNFAAIGIALGMLVSTKINGLLFLPIIAFLMAYALNKKSGFPYRKYGAALGVTVFSCLLVFLILHPNFFFYPEYGPLAQFRDRVLITDEHVAYFSRVNPAHVLLSPQSRIASLVHHVFPMWLTGAAILSLIIFLWNARYRTVSQKQLLFLASGTVVTASVLSYCVFNEPRYYLPIVPFVMLGIGFGIQQLHRS